MEGTPSGQTGGTPGNTPVDVTAAPREHAQLQGTTPKADSHDTASKSSGGRAGTADATEPVAEEEVEQKLQETPPAAPDAAEGASAQPGAKVRLQQH